VPEDAWYRTWAGYDLPVPDPGERERRLPADRDSLLELQRRLIEPYLASAVATDVRLERGGDGLVVCETRLWGSILVPIHLQLLEGLRRVSEGKGMTPTTCMPARRTSIEASPSPMRRCRHGEPAGC
jgi:hypothetical protein